MKRGKRQKDIGGPSEALIQRIRSSPNYTKEIGIRLGIELPYDPPSRTDQREVADKPDYSLFGESKSPEGPKIQCFDDSSKDNDI